MNKIKLLDKDNWKKHPWNYANQIEQVSTKFLKKISNPNSTDETDLLSGEIVHQDKVWEDIKKNGMIEPLHIRINPETKEVRLESGNHRIKTAINDGYTHLPCVVFITKKLIFNEGNGSHRYYIEDFIKYNDLINCPYDYQIRLSDFINEKYYSIIL